MTDDLIVPGLDGAGPPLRQEQGSMMLQRAATNELQATATAAMARALVEARYFLAKKMPRDWLQVRGGMLKDCERPGFAAVARYRKPVGRGIEGPSIRFAEAFLRHATNTLSEAHVMFDDERRRIMRVTVTDLESNTSFFKDVAIEKVVERSSLKPGQEAIYSRINSQGQPVYLVAATEDDLLNKQAALESKALRTLALRLLPGDILDECMDRVKATLNNEVAKDPDAERKRLVDAFATLRVQPSDIKAYLGHEIDKITAKEIVELRAIYSAIRDEEASWVEVMETRTAKREATTTTEKPKTLDDLTKRAEQS
jgi:hypothetical protein